MPAAARHPQTKGILFVAPVPAFCYANPHPAGVCPVRFPHTTEDRQMSHRNPLKKFLIPVLDQVVKPFLIVALCVAGLVFEFLTELPFIVMIGLQRAASGRRR